MINPKNLMMSRIFFVICISLVTFTIIAQPITTYKYDDMLKTADERMELGDYYNALDWYDKAYKEVKSEDVALSIAFCHFKLRDYANAEKWYSRVLEKDVDDIFLNDRYAYGRVLRFLGKDEEAKREFNKFLALSADEELRTQAEVELEGIGSKDDFEPNKNLVVRFLSETLNSGSAEYSPAIFDDKTLYFSSFQARKEIVIDGKEKSYHAKIYKTTRDSKGFSKPEALNRNINRPGFHHTHVTFSTDKRRMYFTRQMIENDEVKSSSIWVSRMGTQDWETPRELANINGDWISTQPAFGELLGTEVLYFVSDMEGGYGGLDIYYAPIQGDGVGSPINLGDVINTSGDEITPFYSDGTLYFSTESQVGLGGLDIFKSTWDGRYWSRPQNLGHNYNSPFDDYHFTLSDRGNEGFLISNRPDERKKKLKSETCCYDIYAFQVKELVIDLLVGVADEEKQPLNGATVELFDLTVYSQPEKQSDEKDYLYNFALDPDKRYQVITTKQGYFPDTLTFNTDGIVQDQQIRKMVLLKRGPSRLDSIPQFIIETVTINEAVRLNNIYYEFDKWDILRDAEDDLNVLLRLMNDYPEIEIELSSHTDSRGLNAYNERLSQKRAESAAQWLTSRGINPDRIKPVGYGETQILNGCVNGVRCTEEEHRFNRRTEFKILVGPESIEIKREVKRPYSGGGQSIFKIDSIPVIEFKNKHQHIGSMKQGDKKEVVFEFTNTGMAGLKIDLATSCKCTEIFWPQHIVQPGESGEIRAIFDSTGMEGVYEKTIDIIANTQPIVKEAKFSVKVVR